MLNAQCLLFIFHWLLGASIRDNDFTAGAGEIADQEMHGRYVLTRFGMSMPNLQRETSILIKRAAASRDIYRG
jgi:hypothetical protein